MYFLTVFVELLTPKRVYFQMPSLWENHKKSLLLYLLFCYQYSKLSSGTNYCIDYFDSIMF
jgi:hypothetical protein